MRRGLIQAFIKSAKVSCSLHTFTQSTKMTSVKMATSGIQLGTRIINPVPQTQPNLTCSLSRKAQRKLRMMFDVAFDYLYII